MILARSQDTRKCKPMAAAFVESGAQNLGSLLRRGISGTYVFPGFARGRPVL
jgi:hypothetical protein